ncbi:hypothetical protein BDW74DRAFT_169709 [Aspergillus multicolor]|uniref:cytochrome P450 n=1 Tax=Aspergillus multicolor TaxID=41759 RepID=UPI003CCD697F
MGAGLTLAVFICFFSIALHLCTDSKCASNIPLVKVTKGKRPWLSGYLSYLSNANEAIYQAYHRYSKHGLICQLPSNTFGTSIILPSKDIPWLLAQPLDLLSFYEWAVESMQARWTLGDTRYGTDDSILHIQHVAIRAASSTMIPQYQDELEHSIDRVLGNDYETWKAVDPAPAMDSILLQSSLRYIVGSPLCANEAFLRWYRIYIRIVFPTSEILRLVPSIMRPVVGNILSLPRWIVLRKLQSLIRPTFDKRLRLLALQPEDSSTHLPQDFLQHLMRSLYQRNSPDLNTHFVTIQLILFSISATFSTSLLASHVFYDILASDPEYNTLAEIHAELNAVFGYPDPNQKQFWTRLETEKLPKIDSILRECLRINNLPGQSMPRKVMTSGLQTPDGYELPKGATVSLLARGPQMDANIYPEPHKFVPFRHLQLKKRLVETGPEFLAFGHQSGSCPGRFLLAVELKMLVAYLVRRYELELPSEYNGKRPQAGWFGEFCLPPKNGRIRIRRKKDL